MKRTIIAMLGCVLMLGGCMSTPSTMNNASILDTLELSSNTGQNVQATPDGFVNVGSTQLDSGVIDSSVVNWQGTAVSGILSINKNGVQVKNPGNLNADTMTIVFGEPITDADGAIVVPIASIDMAGLSNEVTSVIDASTQQVALWTGVLAEISEDQRDAVLAELEAQKVLSAEAVGLIRAALEAASPVP
ncbi:MAG: hypothetical protein ACX94C_11810 [Phycisphaerales bacterium]